MKCIASLVMVAAVQLVLMGITHAQTVAPLTAGSKWVNELGSIMTIQTVATNDLVTGTYVTNVGCGAGKTRNLTGWYNKGAFTFTVNFAECDSIAAWAGQVAIGLSPKIIALWHLVLSGPPKWDGTYAGTDTFVPK
jgi:Avidin family